MMEEARAKRTYRRRETLNPEVMEAGAKTAAAPSPRITRAEGVRQVRRKQRGVTTHTGIKLSVNEMALDRNTYHYRFANDIGNRVQQLVADDYDVVTDVEAKPDSTGLGTVQSTHGGVHSGGPFNMVLLKKRKDWYETDQAERQERFEVIDEQIRRGRDHETSDNPEIKRLGGGVYTPNGRNTIERV